MTLREYRERHGLTLEQAAERCGVLRTTWAMIEAGNGCRTSTAKLIIDGTDGEVTLDDLVPPAAVSGPRGGQEPPAKGA